MKALRHRLYTSWHRWWAWEGNGLLVQIGLCYLVAALLMAPLFWLATRSC